MIPRRRINEDGEGTTMEGESDHLCPSAMSNGTTSMASTMNDEATVAPSTTNSTTRDACCTNRNKRTILFLSIIMVGFFWNFLSEKRVLDNRTYGESREYWKQQSTEKYSTIYNYKRSNTKPSGRFVLNYDTEFEPGIAWLMSFPNSGTSFTMTMVARSTNKSFATNYGNEVIAPDEANSYSIYPRRPEGPYWPGMSGKSHKPRDLPDRFVITKTHCGSRCSKCGPDEYIESTEEFLTRCASGHGEMTPGSKRRTYDVTYSPDWVRRAIHLFRNPMHNVIARYHLEHRHKGYKNDTEWQGNHSNDSEGLHKWCEATKKTYEQEDIDFFGSKEKIPKAPCHGEFYKWTQWHNLAEQSIKVMRDGGLSGGPRRAVPVLKIFYEDYKNEFQNTANSILDFLELKQVAPFRNFTSRSDYGDYFPLGELIEIKQLVKSVATNATWSDVKHYFEGIPDEH